MLVLKREHALWEDTARKYKVFIDEIEVDDIKDGETKNFPLCEGEHSLQLKIDWCSSQKINFVVKNGETTFATCSPAKKPPLIGMFIYVTFKRNNYIDLEILK